MKTLCPLLIFLVSRTIAMATYSAHPSPWPGKAKVSPYREEAQRLIEAFERALQERREDFRERLMRGDTRLIDVENLSGYAHINRDELLRQTDTELNKGTIYKNPEMPRGGGDSEIHRGGMNVVQPKFKVGPLRRRPDQYKQGTRSSKKQGLATQGYHFSHHDSHQATPLFRDHHSIGHDKHTDSQFRVQPMPTRGKHFSKQATTSVFVPEYQQQRNAVRPQRHRHPHRDSSIDNSRDSRGHDISGHFDSHDSSYASDLPFYKNEHPSRRPHVFSKEDKPNSRPHYVNEELDSRERPEVDFIGRHDTEWNTLAGKSFRLNSGEEDEVRSHRHQQWKHPGHHRRTRYKSSISQEADSIKRPYDLQPSMPKFPPVPQVPAPATGATSGKAVFRPIPQHPEDHIDDYNPKHHTLPLRSTLQGVTAFYNGTRRECYACSWFPDRAEGNKPVGWDRCRYAFHHTEAAIFGIRPTSCIDNCYIRVDPDNSVHRGCYRGEDGVSPETLGCHTQGPQRAVYCFCTGGKCNSSNAPAFF